MSNNCTAFIFPAFTSDYDNHPGQNMPGFMERFIEFISRAADSIDPALAGFDFYGNRFGEDELRTQYLTYIYSCAASSWLREAGLTPFLNAGYSMGIYATLSDALSIRFETGLELIRLAYQCVHETLKGNSFGMGTLIGLDRNDIQLIIGLSSLRVEISNQNAAHSFVVSGYRDDIQTLMKLATDEGALHARLLTASVPYHSSHLHQAALDFSRHVSNVEILLPQTAIISLIDQAILSTPENIRLELVRNLHHPLDWHLTMQSMLVEKVSHFIECGSSKSLVKNARFIDGNFRFDSLDSCQPGK